MSEKMHTKFHINESGGLSVCGDQWRLAAMKKRDGTFRVTNQKRSGADLLNKIVLAMWTAGILIPRTVKWRNDSIVREYATREEARKLLKDFDAAIRKSRMEEKLSCIPEEDRARYAKEKGLAL
jgi:hypothetical protein